MNWTRDIPWLYISRTEPTVAPSSATDADLCSPSPAVTSVRPSHRWTTTRTSSASSSASSCRTRCCRTCRSARTTGRGRRCWWRSAAPPSHCWSSSCWCCSTWRPSTTARGASTSTACRWRGTSAPSRTSTSTSGRGYDWWGDAGGGTRPMSGLLRRVWCGWEKLIGGCVAVPGRGSVSAVWCGLTLDENFVADYEIWYDLRDIYWKRLMFVWITYYAPWEAKLLLMWWFSVSLTWWNMHVHLGILHLRRV